MKQRILVAIPAIIITFVVLWLLDWVYIGVLALLSLIAEYEMVSSMKEAKIAIFEIDIYIFTTLLFPAYLWLGLFGVILDVMLLIISMLIRMVFIQKDRFKTFAASLAIFIYPQLFFVFLFALGLDSSPWLARLKVLNVLVAALMSDTFGYFVGRFFGKHKLAPSVSPKKNN